MGAVGGGLWHLLKGLKNSPSGARFRGGIEVKFQLVLVELTTGLLLPAAQINDSILIVWHLFAGCAARSSQNRGKLCGLGRTFLNIRLYISGPPKKSTSIARRVSI